MKSNRIVYKIVTILINFVIFLHSTNGTRSYDLASCALGDLLSASCKTH